MSRGSVLQMMEDPRGSRLTKVHHWPLNESSFQMTLGLLFALWRVTGANRLRGRKPFFHQLFTRTHPFTINDSSGKAHCQFRSKVYKRWTNCTQHWFLTELTTATHPTVYILLWPAAWQFEIYCKNLTHFVSSHRSSHMRITSNWKIDHAESGVEWWMIGNITEFSVFGSESSKQKPVSCSISQMVVKCCIFITFWRS